MRHSHLLSLAQRIMQQGFGDLHFRKSRKLGLWLDNGRLECSIVSSALLKQ
jgi:hypothetical protein